MYPIFKAGKVIIDKAISAADFGCSSNCFYTDCFHPTVKHLKVRLFIQTCVRFFHDKKIIFFSILTDKKYEKTTNFNNMANYTV